MSTLKAPFPWFGGKSRVAPMVWERLGDVPNYVEPFAGSLAVLLGRPEKHAGKIETVNDLDGFVANFWRSIATDPEQTAHHADWPVIEADLNARHAWLVGQRASLLRRLDGGGRGGQGDQNRHKERIYFSPACIAEDNGLLGLLEDVS